MRKVRHADGLFSFCCGGGTCTRDLQVMHTATAFAARHLCVNLWSGLYLFPSTKSRDLPSSLYTFPSTMLGTWLGIVMLSCDKEDFTDFDR